MKAISKRLEGICRKRIFAGSPLYVLGAGLDTDIGISPLVFSFYFY